MRGVLSVMLAGLCGCYVAGATGEQLTSRASFDLDCAPSGLRYRRIDPQTQGVVGCGKRATYVESCARSGTSGEDCTWVLNGRVEASAAPPSPPGAEPPPPPRMPVLPLAPPETRSVAR